MEKENKKSGATAIIITVIVLLLLFAVCLFVLSKQGYLSFDKSDNQIIDNGNSDQNNNNTISNNVIDLSRLDDFKNYDGTYGTIESLRKIPEDRAYDYDVSLTLDGFVKVYNFNNGNSHKINISDVIQISSSDAEKIYMLDKNSQVYVYDLTNFAKGDYNATKVDNANNVVRIFSINYAPIKDAGGASSTIGIKQDGSYVSLDSFRR